MTQQLPKAWREAWLVNQVQTWRIRKAWRWAAWSILNRKNSPKIHSGASPPASEYRRLRPLLTFRKILKPSTSAVAGRDGRQLISMGTKRNRISPNWHTLWSQRPTLEAHDRFHVGTKGYEPTRMWLLCSRQRLRYQNIDQGLFQLEGMEDLSLLRRTVWQLMNQSISTRSNKKLKRRSSSGRRSRTRDCSLLSKWRPMRKRGETL